MELKLDPPVEALKIYRGEVPCERYQYTVQYQCVYSFHVLNASNSHIIHQQLESKVSVVTVAKVVLNAIHN